MSIFLTALAISAGAAMSAHVRPPLYHITLLPGDQWTGGSGVADLALAPSPFDVTLSADGHLLYDITVTVSRLPPATGGSRYVAWVATGDLAQVQIIGPIRADGRASGHVSFNKFIVLVTQEEGPSASHWSGRVVLSGFSPSTYLENYAAKELFNGGVPNQ